MTIQFSGEPRTLPLLALRGYTVFPGSSLSFEVARPASVKALEACVERDQLIFLVTQKDIRTEEPAQRDLYHVGTISRVKQMLRLPGDNIRVLCEGVSRAVLLRVAQDKPFLLAVAGEIEEPEIASTLRVRSLVRAVREAYESYAEFAPPAAKDVVLNILAEEDPATLADYTAANLNFTYQNKQAVLSELNVEKRLAVLCRVLREEGELARVGASIQSRVKEQMDKNQRDYFLREQLKAIRAELGDKEDTQAECDAYLEKLQKASLPAEAEEKLRAEIGRLSRMATTSPESAVVRTYLDTCLSLPWGVETRDKFDVRATERILHADHYGMEDVKRRVLEYIAVLKLSGGVKSQIICLVGPPGTGKTSIAMSVARSLGRKCARVSLGGISDEAEIRGHRRTYIGAMPGRIIQALQNAGSKNCVVVLDEIDKLGRDYKGDPSAALLEVLDPEQNANFRDNYLELPFDLSRVLFIMTANTLDTVPRPLLDRMEVIEISGYTDEEKVQIAKRHLLKKQLKAHGMNARQLRVGESALRRIIRGYTREAGVRSLERQLAALCRKAALSLVDGETAAVHIKAENLKNYLGEPRYTDSLDLGIDRVGLVNGLAYTAVGGEMLQVEVNLPAGDGKLQLTGNLGDVMKESAMAAISYIRTHAEELGIDPEFYKKKDIHIHFPEGAVPKDGPSAGITVTCALVSALTGRPTKSSVAMTGEVTLRGRVLPIGGLKEKTMAAYREGIRTVIIPADNCKDLEKIDATVREGLEFVPVREVSEVLKCALHPAAAEISGQHIPCPAHESSIRTEIRS
ncbi:MAG: endopeptidase La [Clostridia bacterium]|nr:endopeptidase La [Clostridia bacterium]